MLKKLILGVLLLSGGALACAQAAPLHDAVKAGAAAEVNKLLGGGAGVNARDDDGYTPLQLAVLAGHSSEEIGKLFDESLKNNAALKVPVSAGHMAIVRLLVARGADVNATDAEHFTALGWAAALGNKEAVDFLLAHKADPSAGAALFFALASGNDDIARRLVATGSEVNYAGHEGNYPPPLFAAAGRGDAAMVKLLGAKGADAKARDANGESVLHVAARSPHGAKAIDALAALGADVNARNANNWTPLAVAADSGHNDAALRLVARGADINARLDEGRTALIAAELNDARDFAHLLISKGADVNAQDAEGIAALHVAATKDLKEVQLLVAKGAAVNARTVDGRTPLFYAGDKEVAAFLIAKGADVNARNDKGLTPLHLAALGGRKDVAELLVAKGADVNARTINAKGALFFAGNADTAAFLIAKGADVNARASDDNTPLHDAAAKSHKDVVELLLAHGADVNAHNKEGYTPLSYARSRDAAEALLARGADVKAKAANGNTPLHDAVSRNGMEVAEVLLAHGAEVNARNADGRAPLHLAAAMGANPLVNLLYTRGAEVNVKDKSGETAVLHASPANMVFLVSNGADVNARYKNGTTLLQLAASGGKNDLVKLLLEKGADVNARNNEGMTALFYAASREIASTLIAKGANVEAKSDSGLTPLFFAHDRAVAAALVAAGAVDQPVAFHEPEMAAAPAGTLELAPSGENKAPVYVEVRQFEIGKTEITQAEWRALMGYNPSFFKGANLPVDSVNWLEAHEFIKKLNQKTGRQYRLPSEREWEYACYGGAHTEYCGGDKVNDVAWYGGLGEHPEGNSEKTTHPVGTRKANAFGIFDMSGNVAEWTENPGVTYADSDTVIEQQDKVSTPPVRGGSWASRAAETVAAFRSSSPYMNSLSYIGFRVARSVE